MTHFMMHTTGYVEIQKEQVSELIPNETIAFTVASKAESFAINDRWLAVSAGQKVYICDMESGHDAVELSGTSRHIQKVCFDQDGHICAVSDAGDVWVWDNPLKEILLENAPNCVMFEQYESADGHFLVTYEPDGTILVKDRKTDGVIFQSSLIKEPLKGVFMEDATDTSLVQELSDTCYHIDASSVLGNYSNDTAVQKANYDALAEALISHVCDELQIIARTQ